MKKLSLFLIALAMILVSCKPDEPEGPEVVTTEVTEITVNSAVCRGGVSDGGGAAIIERGFCWNTEGKPTVLDFCIKDTESELGSFTVEITDLDPNTQYYVRAYAANANGVAGYGEERTFKTLAAYSPATGTSNGYGYVDLGLSVKWATCNVGASSPEEYGDYFAWGGTTTKAEYNESNCPTYGLIISELQSFGYIDSEGNLAAQYDAATANWGGDWRMPTSAEYNELLNNCTLEWTTQNGVNGYKVIGPSGASIFLPAAGYRYGSSLKSAGSDGSYWMSTPNVYFGNYNACGLDFGSDFHYMCNFYRYSGLSVRPVLE